MDTDEFEGNGGQMHVGEFEGDNSQMDVDKGKSDKGRDQERCRRTEKKGQGCGQ